MRSSRDPTLRRPRAPRHTRLIIIAAIVVVIILIASLRGLARFSINYLWFQSVGYTSVFRGVLLTKVVLALVFIAIFFVLMFVSLTIADRVAPFNVDPATHDELVVRYRDVVSPRGRWARIAVSFIFALLAGVSTDREWNNWDLFRYHVSFGTTDAQFHKDVGFYVFQLPFISFLLGWAFEAVVVVLIVTVVAQYLNGGITVQPGQRGATPSVKAHISVLLGVLALIKAVDYYYERLELVLSRSHVVNGATATSVHADKPAKTLLIAIAVIAAALFLYNIRQRGWILPAVGVALWAVVYVLVGAVYPAVYQAVRVNPSEFTREQQYIQDNINATQKAYNLSNVIVCSSGSPCPQSNQTYDYSPTVSSSDIEGNGLAAQANKQTLANVRLLDPPVALLTTFNKYQGIRSYYQFNDLDLDRYVLQSSQGQDQETATMTSVRELTGAVPGGFVNQHLEYTHGYGAVIVPVSQSGVNSDGTPNFTLADLPPTAPAADPDLDLSSTGNEIYFGENLGGYVIAGSKTQELDYQQGNQEITNHYAGGGVDAGSLFRRTAFALAFGDANFVLSGQITKSSKVLYYRDIVQRAQKAAPFLKFDSDPYATVLNGSVYWILDAYTTTDNYPYSQNANISGVPGNSGLNSTFNYVRNSVKVVINAYSGKMYFFVVDQTDPIIQVYERAFPDLFIKQNPDNVIPGITDHFRYPEDIFQVQANMYGRYHLTNASEFYTQAQAWAVSPDPGSGELTQSASAAFAGLGGTGGSGTFNSTTALTSTSNSPLMPEYELAHLPGQTGQTFMLILPFVPAAGQGNNQNLTAYMTASSDWGSSASPYGQMTVYETPPSETVQGPELISSAIRSNQAITSELTLFNQQGSAVELGEVDIVPLDQSLMYVQPLYVESTSNKIPTLRDVIVVYNGQLYHSGNASLDGALCQIGPPFQAYCGTPAATTPAPGATTTVTTPTGPSSSTITSLLNQAKTDFANADAALKAGDFSTFGTDYNAGVAAVSQADGVSSTSTTTTLPKGGKT